MKTRCEIGKWSEKTYKLNEKGTDEDNKDMTKPSMFTRSRTIIDSLQLVCITVNTSMGSLNSLFHAKDNFSNTQCNLCILIYRYYGKCAILNKCMHKCIYSFIYTFSPICFYLCVLTTLKFTVIMLKYLNKFGTKLFYLIYLCFYSLSLLFFRYN